LREVVLDRLASRGDRPETALLAGFLVGETAGLSEFDLENLRRAGLTHFVAVSGSNVALFLGVWWLVAGPLGLGPRLRAFGGLVALGVFVVATRWEPSVVRAATMAAVVLAGRIVGLPVDAWRGLGITVTGLLLVSGDLATDVGFQLSVAATAGVLSASRVAGRHGRGPLRALLVATVGAQLAVLPILLARFGTVPLLSPVANLLATPLVTAATFAGGIGVLLGSGQLMDVGIGAAHGVFVVAEQAAVWPQLGIVGVAGVAAAVAALRIPVLRIGVVSAAATLLTASLLPIGSPAFPSVTFLDIGQGDAILVRDPSGVTALVDGGRDPAVLRAALRRQGVDHLDLVVATHGDADHVGGLVGLAADVPIGGLWYPADQQLGEMLAAVIADVQDRGRPVRAVTRGDRVRLGGIDVRVLGPQRRYAADNDGSVVLWVATDTMTMLLTGDVEAVGQAELPTVRPDVLQVPHHGSTTSDPEWLAATVGEVAVVSVGANTYGHPDPGIMATLDAAGAVVHTTQAEGDIIVPLCVCAP